MPDNRRQNAAGWKQVAASLDKIGAACAARGITFSYHNHAFEFETFDGQTGMDILFGQTNPQHVKAELDLFWVKKGGQDPVAYIHQFGKRAHLLHLKDMADGPDQKFAPVGSGTFDFKSIIAAGQKAGTQWYVVEQDNCYDTPPLEAVKISIDNLKKLGVR